MIRHSLALTAVLVSLASSWALAQELTTDAERSWRELRDSDDVKTKLMAERWHGAIKQQEWTDASGKFKTSAKYVAHDPQLAWIRLRVIQGAGDKRVVKELQIPLVKLNAACQARARQIARLSDKIAEALVAEKKRKAEDKSHDANGEIVATGPDSLRGGLEMEAGETEEPPAPAPTPSPPPPTADLPPLPALIPKVPAGLVETPSPTNPSAAAPPADTGEVADGANASGDAWRTSYEAFRANVTPPSRLLQTVSFGPMTELQSAHETMMRCESDGDVGDEDIQEMQQSCDAVGEVTWESTLTGTSDLAGDWTSVIGLPPLPEPIQIGFSLDTDRDPGAWQNLKAGDRVRFVGRFLQFDDEYGMNLAIRFVEILPADAAAQAAHE